LRNHSGCISDDEPKSEKYEIHDRKAESLHDLSPRRAREMQVKYNSGPGDEHGR
jgi:hypothetical protein